MIKRKQKISLLLILSFIGLNLIFTHSNAMMSISYLKLEDIDWIVPNINQIALGLEPEFAFQPDGTMEIIYLYPAAYSEKLLYIDNSTGSWSTPEIIADPQYGAMNPGILIDNNNITHVSYRADAGGVYHLNYSEGAWSEEGMGGSQLTCFTPKMALGPDGTIHYVYYWIQSSSSSYSGGITYINNTDFEPHNTNNTITRFEQRPDIAVDSTGLVHIVFEGSWNNTALGATAVRDIFYQTFDPAKKEDQFSEVIRLSSVESTADYAELPKLICDANDNLHLIYVQTSPDLLNGITVHRASIKYMLIDSDPAPSDAVIINTIRSFTYTPDFTVDAEGDIHVVFSGYPQTEFDHDYTSDLIYATNKTGEWVNERITNQPYTVGFPRIAINPLNDMPTILYLIKQAYSTDAYMMEYIEYTGSNFGNHFNVSTSLSNNENNVKIIEEEAYKYILITENEPIKLDIAIENVNNKTVEYNVDFIMIENDFVSIINGSATQSVDSLNSETSQDLLWYFQVSSGQTGTLELQVKQNSILIGKILYMFNIGKAEISIPFGSIPLIIFSVTIGIIGIQTVIKKKIE